jgi:hypothetical protein
VTESLRCPCPGGCIHEGITTTSAPLATTETLGRWRIFPNPSREAVQLELGRALPGDADVLVFDAAGRLVRRLHGVEAGAGLIRARWDGTDSAGRVTGAGVYFVATGLDGTGGRVVGLAR